MDTSLLERMVAALGLRAIPQPLGGATGAVWAVGDQVLRVGPRTRIDKELAAAEAASAVVPVPAVVDRVDLGDQTGLLLTRIAGVPAAEVADCSVAEAFRRGTSCGALHRRLATVPAPAGVPPVDEAAVDGEAVNGEAVDGVAPVLLHLDLHPLNVLVDPSGQVVALLDWANAAVGPAELELARTASILTADPQAVAWQQDARCRALVEGWRQESGWDGVQDRARAWALRFMLDDLSDRHSAEELRAIRAALEELEQRLDEDVGPSR
ncbi:MAG TPA: phosphotransferase [Microlunatus sp.]|nr:phosphotransferase [Microlunatus sp.]